MCCLEGRLFFRAQGYSLLSLMVNPALIVRTPMQYGGHYREVVYYEEILVHTY